MVEPILKPVDRLSVWDISHYWHNANPQTSIPSKLPIEVQKTLRALALKASKSLYLRCGNGFVYKSLTDPENELPLSYIRRLYKREFKYVIEGRKYKKSFLSSLNMSRVGVLVWCKENGFKPPSFWFADDDPLLAKPPQELGRKFTQAEIEQYGLVLLLNEESKPADEHIHTPSDSDLSQGRPDFPEKTSFIKEAISAINKANAKARFAPAEKLKYEFREYYEANGYKNKSRAAREYFDSLTIEQRKILVPSYNEREHKDFYRLAVRNLLKVLKTTD